MSVQSFLDLAGTQVIIDVHGAEGKEQYKGEDSLTLPSDLSS